MTIKHIMYAPRDGSMILGYSPGIGWSTIKWDKNDKVWRRASHFALYSAGKRHPIIFDTDTTAFNIDDYARQLERDRYVYDNRFVLTRGRKPNGAIL